nr:unnamed protein product [Callosobruchus analis]
MLSLCQKRVTQPLLDIVDLLVF